MEETVYDNDNDINMLAAKFIDGMAVRKYTAKTIQSYGYVVTGFAQFMNDRSKRNGTDITAQDIADYRLMLVERGLAQNSLSMFLSIIGYFCRYLHDNDHIFVNPTAGMRMPGPDRRLPPVPTEEEVSILLARPDTSTPIGIRDRAILETLYSTAIRNGEMMKLDVKSVDMTSMTMRVMGKGQKERIVPVGKEALNWIKRYLSEVRDGLLNGNREEPALWLNTYGGRLSGQQLNIFIKWYARSCEGISTHITTHALRRACATHMLRNGASPLEIQLLLGHADLTHLRNYLRVSIADLKAAHERSRLGE